MSFNHQTLTNFLFSNSKMAIFWFVVRVYIGWLWLESGIDKITNPAWFGNGAGTALKGFIGGALKKTSGDHPDVQFWYAWFLESVVLPTSHIWSYVIVFGEILVGVALILGILTTLAAFFGSFMNLNFLFSGAVSINPSMFVLAIGIMLAWKVSSKIGLNPILSKWFPDLRIFRL